MLLSKRSSFFKEGFPPSYLNRKYFFILDLPKSPKKYNPSPKQMGKRNPSPEAGMELGGRGAFPLPFLAHTAKSASVMCQMACRCKAGRFQQPPSLPPSCSHAESSPFLSQSPWLLSVLGVQHSRSRGMTSTSTVSTLNLPFSGRPHPCPPHPHALLSAAG